MARGWPSIPRLRAGLRAVAIAAAVLTSLGHPAGAEEPPADGIPPISVARSLPDNGDPTGLRRTLAEQGVLYGFVYTGEVLGNAMGGIRRGAVYQGKLESLINVDLERLVGLDGLSFFTNQFQIHNTGRLRSDYTFSLNTISNIEALRTTRLSELWLEQKFLGDKVSLRVGQLAADAEFFIAGYSTTFLTSDWPTITGNNLPSGGAAYPLSTPGVRLKVTPNENWVGLVALLNGDPSGFGRGREGQVENSNGLNFRLKDPPFLIGEVQHRLNQGDKDTDLAGTVRFGGWHHFGRFDDLRFDNDLVSLANSVSTGINRRLRGNSGLYGIIDQQLYRPPEGNANSGVTFFTRISGSPSDRNLIEFYVDGGVLAAGMVPGRPDDRFGVTALYARIADAVRGREQDQILLLGRQQPVQTGELSLAAIYDAQVVPGWSVQPSVHYVNRPSGGVPRPDKPEAPVRDALVFGVRSVIVY